MAAISGEAAAIGGVDERALLRRVPTQLLIAGAWQEGAQGQQFAVEDPSTEEQIAEIADADIADALSALASADEAQADWAALAPRARSEILRAGYERLIVEADRFALLMTLEMGKSLKEAHGEVLYAAEFLRWFSEEAVRVSGRYQRSPGGALTHLISKRPVGPCLLITPWNFPLAMITRKVGPAIAAGCTMIVKPAFLTPLTAAYFVALMQEVGIPPGVLNFIPTTKSSDVVGALIADPRLKKVSFTGSTHVGRIILSNASQNILRSSMELGGNAPFIVFDDADLDSAVEGAFQAKLRNIGQACTAANRFYVHERLADAFTAQLRERFEAVTIARGVGGGDIVGPLISAQARLGVHRLVEDAVERGARLVTGGEIIEGNGYFYPPTILSDVSDDARVMREEIFGPVAPISRFTDEREVLALANSSEYGLASYIYTRDLNRALRVKASLEAGMVGINTGVISDPAAPFGGIKHSGLGREGAAEGIEEYLTTQYAGIGGI